MIIWKNIKQKLYILSEKVHIIRLNKSTQNNLKLKLY